MTLHQLPLVGIEPAGLAQDDAGDADLAGVVHGRCGLQEAAILLRPAAGGGLGPGVGGHAPDVDAFIGVLVFCDDAKHGDGVAVALFKAGDPDQRQVGAHLGAQDGRRDGLGDVVHRTGGKALRLVEDIPGAGDEDDGYRQSGRVGLEGTADLIAVDVWQLDVEQD